MSTQDIGWQVPYVPHGGVIQDTGMGMWVGNGTSEGDGYGNGTTNYAGDPNGYGVGGEEADLNGDGVCANRHRYDPTFEFIVIRIAAHPLFEWRLR